MRCSASNSRALAMARLSDAESRRAKSTSCSVNRCAGVVVEEQQAEDVLLHDERGDHHRPDAVGALHLRVDARVVEGVVDHDRPCVRRPSPRRGPPRR